MTRRLSLALVMLAVFQTAPIEARETKGEMVILTLPAGFHLAASSSTTTTSVREFVPAGETPDAWTQMLTEQVVYGVKSIDPDTLPNTMSAGWRAACPGGEARKIHQGLEGAYPVSIWMFLCPRNPAIRAPENMWMKIISGQDNLYAVQLAHRRDATPDIVMATMKVLRSVTACDDRKTPGGCVPGKPPNRKQEF